MAAPRLSDLIRRAPAPAAAFRRLSGRTGDGWRAYLMRTVTGQLGPSLAPVSGSWSVELNGTESGSVTVRKADLGGIPPRWFTPWWGAVAFTYTHAGVERPVIAGPITGWPSETRNEITFDFAGIRAILARRVIAAEGGIPAKTDVTFTGLSPGTAAWEAVRVGLDRPDGGLPIVHGSPAETVTGAPARAFPWWNLANNNLDAFLADVSGEENGPDIMFRPRWVGSTKSAIEWAMVHGSSDYPPIPQTGMPDWDATGSRSDVQAVTVRSSADNLANRVWITGTGEEAGTVVTLAESRDFPDVGGPFLETVISKPDEMAVARLYAAAAGELARSGDMVDQISMTVRASDPKTPMGLWHVGDSANVTLAGHLSVPDGSRYMRVIKASGGLDDSVTVEFQEDKW